MGAGAGMGMACEPEWFPPDPTDDRSRLVGDGETPVGAVPTPRRWWCPDRPWASRRRGSRLRGSRCGSPPGAWHRRRSGRDGESGGTHGDRPVQGAAGRREKPAQRPSVKDALLFGGSLKMNMAFMNCSFSAA